MGLDERHKHDPEPTESTFGGDRIQWICLQKPWSTCYSEIFDIPLAIGCDIEC